MKRSGIALSVISMLLVLGIAFKAGSKTSPGPLSPPHSGIDELGCEACHGSNGRDLAEACGECHEEIRAQLTAARGFHGGLPQANAMDCAACHVEHLGDELRLVSRVSFALSGVPDRDAYEHTGLSCDLVGTHASLACRDCRRHADLEFMSPGQRRFLGLTQGCTGCHEDVHEGSYGPDCATCHGQAHPFPDVAEFEHATGFPLVGGHETGQCSTCHDPASDHSVGLLMESGGTAIRRCRECHADPHVVAEGAAPEQLFLTDAGDCSRCHGVRGFSGVRFGPAQHEAIGVRLAGAHGSAKCRKCHAVKRLPAAAGEGGRLSRCLACHESPHRREFTLEESCSGCHDASHDTFGRPPAGMSRALHEASGFSLAPPHRGLGCESCHGPGGRPWAERFPGRLAANCGECHADPHAGQFEKVPLADSGCLGCHAATSWSLARYDHRTLEPSGAHQGLSCEKCHAGGVYVATPRECAGCHQDDYDTALSPDHRRSGFSRSCEGCHSTSRWTGASFDHDTLSDPGGAHTTLSCKGCHQGDYDATRDPDHDAAGFPLACERCHGTSTWRGATFNHRFPITRGAHKKLTCTDCHEVARNYRVFSCTTCHKHRRARMDRKHWEEPDYVFSSPACLKCHPNGKH